MRRKVASRFLLPLEMFLGVSSIAVGISGALGGGALHRAVESVASADWWGYTLGILGAFRVMVAAAEWFLGREWEVYECRAPCPWSIYKSVSARAVIAFFSIPMWIYVAVAIWMSGNVAAVMSIMLMAPFAAGFSWWSFQENMKVRYVIDPRYETRSGLRFHR